MPAEATAGDARAFSLGERFAAVLAPMQLLQVLDGPAERVSCLPCAAGQVWHPHALLRAFVDAIADLLVRSLSVERDEQNVQRMLNYLERAYWKFMDTKSRTAFAQGPRASNTQSSPPRSIS